MAPVAQLYDVISMYDVPAIEALSVQHCQVRLPTRRADVDHLGSFLPRLGLTSHIHWMTANSRSGAFPLRCALFTSVNTSFRLTHLRHRQTRYSSTLMRKRSFFASSGGTPTNEYRLSFRLEVSHEPGSNDGIQGRYPCVYGLTWWHRAPSPVLVQLQPIPTSNCSVHATHLILRTNGWLRVQQLPSPLVAHLSISSATGLTFNSPTIF